MSDLIDRQAAIDAVGYWHGVDASEALEKLPSVETERKGHWILSDDREWKTCSNCGAEVDVSMGTGVYVGVDAVDELRFCPSCGARMMKEGEEHD